MAAPMAAIFCRPKPVFHGRFFRKLSRLRPSALRNGGGSGLRARPSHGEAVSLLGEFGKLGDRYFVADGRMLDHDRISAGKPTYVRAMAIRELRRIALYSIFFATLILAAAGFAQRSAPGLRAASEVQQTGNLVSVRKVPVGHHFVTRYPQLRYYLLYLSVRVSDRTYCASYETPVIQEIDGLIAAKDSSVAVVVNGKRLTVRTPNGRIVKALLSERNQC